jgi:periplasmic divalent cation tolerance protein
MPDARVVLTTIGSMEEALALAKGLVSAGHAACANCLPGVVSVYLWQGRLQQDGEVLLVLKTTAAALPGLKQALAGAHPYEVPELLALPVVDGHEPYLAWLGACAPGPAEV